MPPPKKKSALIGIETDRSRPEAQPRLPTNAPYGDSLAISVGSAISCTQ